MNYAAVQVHSVTEEKCPVKWGFFHLLYNWRCSQSEALLSRQQDTGALSAFAADI
jgi:hypothetical protein